MIHGKRTVGVFLLACLLPYLFVSPAGAVVVKVPVGTPVQLVLVDSVSAADAQVGQKVRLTVSSDVMVGGRVAIASGASALAEVVRVEEQGMVGKPGVISLSLVSVEAVDGSNVPLTGTRTVEGENKQTTSIVVTILCCVLGLLMKGGPADLAEGTSIGGTVSYAAEVDVR